MRGRTPGRSPFAQWSILTGEEHAILTIPKGLAKYRTFSTRRWHASPDARNTSVVQAEIMACPERRNRPRARAEKGVEHFPETGTLGPIVVPCRATHAPPLSSGVSGGSVRPFSPSPDRRVSLNGRHATRHDDAHAHSYKQFASQSIEARSWVVSQDHCRAERRRVTARLVSWGSRGTPAWPRPADCSSRARRATIRGHDPKLDGA